MSSWFPFCNWPTLNTETQPFFITLSICICKHPVKTPSFSPKAALAQYFFRLYCHAQHKRLNTMRAQQRKMFHFLSRLVFWKRPRFILGQAEGHLILICQKSQTPSRHVCISWLHPPPNPPTSFLSSYPFWDDNLLIMEERAPGEADSSRGHRIINPSQMGLLQTHTVSPTQRHTQSHVHVAE